MRWLNYLERIGWYLKLSDGLRMARNQEYITGEESRYMEKMVIYPESTGYSTPDLIRGLIESGKILYNKQTYLINLYEDIA